MSSRRWWKDRLWLRRRTWRKRIWSGKPWTNKGRWPSCTNDSLNDISFWRTPLLPSKAATERHAAYPAIVSAALTPPVLDPSIIFHAPMDITIYVFDCILTYLLITFLSIWWWVCFHAPTVVSTTQPNTLRSGEPLDISYIHICILVCVELSCVEEESEFGSDEE